MAGLKMGKKKTVVSLCPCGSGRAYENCCQVFHLGEPAPTPEALMRSRYTAYVLGLADYLLATWHPRRRPPHLDLQEDHCQWLGLEILRAPGAEGEAGLVEFVARYKINGRAHRLHEVSRFEREAGRWYYLDGTFPGE